MIFEILFLCKSKTFDGVEVGDSIGGFGDGWIGRSKIVEGSRSGRLKEREKKEDNYGRFDRVDYI